MELIDVHGEIDLSKCQFLGASGVTCDTCSLTLCAFFKDDTIVEFKRKVI